MCWYEEASWSHFLQLIAQETFTLTSLLVCNWENKRTCYLLHRMYIHSFIFIKTVLVIDILFLFSFKNRLFRTFSLWLKKPRLHEPNLFLPALPPQYNSSKLAALLQGNMVCWTALQILCLLTHLLFIVFISAINIITVRVCMSFSIQLEFGVVLSPLYHCYWWTILGVTGTVAPF
jgi:hypothetical protein